MGLSADTTPVTDDQTVVPTFKHVAMTTGQGGYNTFYSCELNEDEEESENAAMEPEASDPANPKRPVGDKTLGL